MKKPCFILLTLIIILTSCFSAWEGDGSITINFGGTARSLFVEEDQIDNFTHRVIVRSVTTGKEIIKDFTSKTGSVSVTPGLYIVTVKASDSSGLRAYGLTNDVFVNAGENKDVPVSMYSAAEVKDDKELYKIIDDIYDKLAYEQNNGRELYILLKNDIFISDNSFYFAFGNITIIAENDVKICNAESRTSAGIFTISNEAKITLGREGMSGFITIYGINNNTTSLISVYEGGKLVMKDGITLTGNKIYEEGGYGGAVYVSSDGTFTMEGGTITGNRALYGGGVYIENGFFYKNGGTINNNTSNNGNEVYAEYYIWETSKEISKYRNKPAFQNDSMWCTYDSYGFNFSSFGWDGELITSPSLFQSGIGTEDDPYIIMNQEHLRNVIIYNSQSGTNGKYFKLGSIIYMTGTTNPIGDFDNPFRGTFDGNGFFIRDLNINSGNNAGLFGVIEGGVVKNLGLMNASIQGANATGGIAGSFRGDATIVNCYVTGFVSGTNGVGGIVGEMSEGNNEIEYCYTTADVAGQNFVGGIVGHIAGANGVIKNNVALNLIISASSTTANFGCITGSDPGSGFSFENYARDDMLFSILGGAINYDYVWSTTLQRNGFLIESSGFWKQPAGWIGLGFIDVWVFGYDDPWNTQVFELPRLDNSRNVDIPITFFEGNGTENDPFQIFTEKQFDNVRREADGHYEGQKHFKLMRDIELLSNWKPIPIFSDVFDGGGKTITINNIVPTENGFSGLFAKISTGWEIVGIVKNLRLEGFINLTPPIPPPPDLQFFLGAVTGENHGNILNISSSVVITGASSYIGGIVGLNFGSISNCYNTGSVNVTGNAGGIVGQMQATGTVVQCWVDGFVVPTLNLPN